MTRECRWCGASYEAEPKAPVHRFCSPGCRVSHFKASRRYRNLVGLVLDALEGREAEVSLDPARVGVIYDLVVRDQVARGLTTRRVVPDGEIG